MALWHRFQLTVEGSQCLVPLALLQKDLRQGPMHTGLFRIERRSSTQQGLGRDKVAPRELAFSECLRQPCGLRGNLLHSPDTPRSQAGVGLPQAVRVFRLIGSFEAERPVLVRHSQLVVDTLVGAREERSKRRINAC